MGFGSMIFLDSIKTLVNKNILNFVAVADASEKFLKLVKHAFCIGRSFLSFTNTEHWAWYMVHDGCTLTYSYELWLSYESRSQHNKHMYLYYVSEHLNVQSEVCDKSLIVKFQNSLPYNRLSGIHFSLVPFQPQAVYFHLWFGLWTIQIKTNNWSKTILNKGKTKSKEYIDS